MATQVLLGVTPTLRDWLRDILTVAQLPPGPGAVHYVGTLLTFGSSAPGNVVRVYRLVDGQQRLTTVSILLACIAETLGPEGRCGGWTASDVKDRLTNPDKSPERLYKLRLQEGDQEEYRSVLEGNPSGPGAVVQAWRVTQRLVERSDIGQLLVGLERLRVVGLGIKEHEEEPQQIFESLNATGRPLTESEKLKNWLLMGLSDAEQQDLYDRHWKRIEISLGAKYATGKIDIFLRDFLRWKTGELRGVKHVYEDLRRWLGGTGRLRIEHPCVPTWQKSPSAMAFLRALMDLTATKMLNANSVICGLWDSILIDH